MSYVKNYNVGQTTVDLPYANYIHVLPVLSFGDIQHTVNLALVFNFKMYSDGDNSFGIRAGYKLNLQKKLVISNSVVTHYQDELGRKIALNKFNSSYTFDDESQRILRKSGSDYYVENPDYSKEKYNSSGLLVAVYDKYDSANPYLTYSYTGDSLQSITYRGTKKISVVLGSNSASISYIVNNTTVCTTNLTYSSNTNVTVNHYSGVDYYFEIVGNNLTVESKDSGSSTVKESAEYSISTKSITVINKVGTTEVDKNIYTFPGDASLSNILYSQVIITDFYGVNTKTQYNGKKPMYSYEVFSISGESKLAPKFLGTKHMGNVNIYSSEETVISNNALGIQSAFEGIALVKSGNTYTVDLGEVVKSEGYYTISGWIKPTSINGIIKIVINCANGTKVTFPLNFTPDKEWTYFMHKAFYSSVPTTVTIEDQLMDLSLRDFRCSFYSTVDETDTTEQERPYRGSDELLLTDWNNYCNFTDVKFRINGVDSDKKITSKDILKYKLNLRKGVHSDEFYANNCKEIISITSTTSITAKIGSTYYTLSSCDIGQKIYTANGEWTTRFITDSGGFALIQKTAYSINSVYASKKYDEKLDLVYEEKDRVGTTYTRNSKGLVTSEKTEIYEESSVLYTRTSTYDTNLTKLLSTTNEFGETTSYTTDDTWGVVRTQSASTGEMVQDVFDDDMTAVTVRNFSKQGTGRSTNFTYASGKLDKLKHHSIRYGYSYSGNDITKVNRWHESNDTILGTCFEREIIKGTDNNTTVTTHYPLNTSSRLYQIKEIYDKYGRLSSIDGVLENTYDSFPAFNNNQLVPTVDNKDGLLAVSKDLKAGQTKHYTYANNKIHNVKTLNTSSSAVVSTESFTYDGMGRSTSYLYTGTGVNHETAYEYVHPVGNIKADNRISKLRYKINGAEKALTEYSYDSYKRVSRKKYTISGKTFQKNYGFNSTRVASLTHTINSSATHNISYNYDTLGRITAESDSVDTNRNVTYQYDAFGQLVRENNKLLDKTFVYSYNSIGNITSVKTYAYTTAATPSGSYSEKLFSYDSTHADRLTSYDGKSITYNPIGYPTSYDGKTYAWTRGRLTGISSGSLTTGTSSYTFEYNAYGQRIKSSYRYFVPPGSAAQMDYVSSATKTFEYDNSGRLISQKYIRVYNTGDSDTNNLDFLYDGNSVIGFIHYNGSTSATYYYNRNLLGDVTEIYNTSGNVVATYKYDAFGNCTTTSSSSLGSINPIRYRGYYYDEDTKLYYLNSRYYNPEWRRFISPDDTSYIDPGTPNGLNLYCYCNNDPVNFVDPSGHAAISTAILIAICAFGIVGGQISYSVASDSGADEAELFGSWLIGLAGGVSFGALLLATGPFGAALLPAAAATTSIVATVAAVSAGVVVLGGILMLYDGQWPGDDPTQAPDGFEWRGSGEPGSSQGNWYNPKTQEILHPDLNHPQPIGPHWDFRDLLKQWWRIFKNGKFPK